MTFIRLKDNYDLHMEFIGDQIELTCRALNGAPPCALALRFPLAWLAACSQGRRVELDRVLAHYEAHKQEVHCEQA